MGCKSFDKHILPNYFFDHIVTKHVFIYYQQGTRNKTREKPNMSKSKGTVRKEEFFEYLAVPNLGTCITVNNTVEDLTAAMEESQLVDSDDDVDREKKVNPHMRTAEQAKEALSNLARLREIGLQMDRLEHALNKANRGTSRGPRSERSLSPKNQHRRGAPDAKGRIPRTRDASRDSSIGEVINGQAKGRAIGKAEP
jgi:hypothetical protein